MTGISKSQVSRLCEELDEEEVARFRGRPLEGPYPYVLWVEATYVKARQDGRVVSVAVVAIAVGVKAETGEREVLGLDVGPSEDGAFWTSFLRSLVTRGLSGVRLVSPATPTGASKVPPIEAVLQGASWQRCRVHFMRNALSLWSPRRPRADGGGDHPSAPSSPSSPTHQKRPPAVAQGRGRLPLALPEVGRPDGRSRGRCPLLRGVPRGASAEDLV